MLRRLMMASAALALIGASAISVASANDGRNGAFAFGALSGLVVGALAQAAALPHRENTVVQPQQVHVAPPPVYYAPPEVYYVPPPVYYAVPPPAYYVPGPEYDDYDYGPAW